MTIARVWTNSASDLDDINKISLDQLNEISQACDEIGKELSKIEEEGQQRCRASSLLLRPIATPSKFNPI